MARIHSRSLAIALLLPLLTATFACRSASPREKANAPVHTGIDPDKAPAEVASGIGGFFNMIGSAIDYLTGNTPAVAARKMLNPSFPDQRWQGVNYFAAREFGHHDPYTRRYTQMARDPDEDWFVRATAVRALNRSRDRRATPLFVKGLTDKNDQVRLESAKALINVPDAAAAPTLTNIVGDRNDNRDVRIAAADALKHYKDAEVARALVNVLGEREFAIAWQARRSLRAITGKDYHYDEAAWLAYLRKS